MLAFLITLSGRWLHDRRFDAVRLDRLSPG